MLSTLLAVTLTLTGWQIALIASVIVLGISMATEPPPQGMFDFSGFRSLVLAIVLAAAWVGYAVARLFG